jgi:superfamily I DNA/RNA helicase
MLSRDGAAILQESAVEMAEDIQGREGGDALMIEDLGIFARPDQCIQLLIVHKAKGREFEAVTVIEAHDGRFPHFSIDKITDQDERQAQYDESRRVVYVATTRAMRLLMFFSDRTDFRNRPTPFLQRWVCKMQANRSIVCFHRRAKRTAIRTDSYRQTLGSYRDCPREMTDIVLWRTGANRAALSGCSVMN